ncbi:MAG: ABC transporter permease [Peptococcaceae bacterium]|nr:ABC transporter permease [Peptococcaceae bacterium]
MALPFENNTDRAIKKLARASFQSEGRRNLLAGLIVFGAAFLLSFAAILAVNAALALEVSEGVTSDRELVTVLFGVALVVLLAAGLAIRNIMYLSVLGRTREFAQLRTLGATNRQIRCIVSAERRRMTRSWLATGVLAGFFGNVLLPLEFFWVQSASMAVAAAAFTWFVVYLSFRAPAQQAARVSPMDGLRQTAMLGIGQPRRKGPFCALDVSAHCASQRAFVAKRDWPPVAFQRSEKNSAHAGVAYF